MRKRESWVYRGYTIVWRRHDPSAMGLHFIVSGTRYRADTLGGAKALIRHHTGGDMSVAEAFAGGRLMRLADAKALGRAHGRAIAESVLSELGITCAADVLALDDGIYAVYDAIGEAEPGFRQYSPFEFYAAAINRRDAYLGEGESERGWDAYDEAFLRGCQAAFRAAGLGSVLS